MNLSRILRSNTNLIFLSHIGQTANRRRAGRMRLTTRVFRRVFLGYAVLCVFIIVGQLSWEYMLTTRNVERDLQALGRSFVPSVTDALWNYQDTVLQATVAGIRENPVVTGVSVEKSDGSAVAIAGHMPDPDREPTGRWWGIAYQKYTAPLTYRVGDNDSTIGRIVIVSDFTVVEDRLVSSFVTSLGIAIINAGLLWLLFYVVFIQTISRPLSGLSRQVDGLEISASGGGLLDYPEHDEIGALVSAFNRLNARLVAANREMEAKVEERTRELKILTEELKILSNKDSLTGCFNRRYMDERLDNEIARSKRYGNPLSITICDLDHFKVVNDTYGHALGDLVLREFSHLLLAGIRKDIDWVVRLGGEEFLVVLPETPLAMAAGVIERHRQAFGAHEIRTANISFCVTASFGIVSTDVVGPDMVTAPNLLAAADRALYQAKAKGRNCVVLYETAL